MIKKYIVPLKSQFLRLISCFSYPVINWLEFVKECTNWELMGPDLTSTDIDRIFIATNFEEEDLEQNDDNSLVRFEFLEILVRIAKCKYYDKKKTRSITEALERLITTLIIPNSQEPMEWQAFRDDSLWCLEVDDLFKANESTIRRLYGQYCKKVIGKTPSLSKNDVVRMIKDAEIKLTEDQTTIAYAYSKATLEDEMSSYDMYNEMPLHEFYEFLGRAAALLVPGNGPLS